MSKSAVGMRRWLEPGKGNRRTVQDALSKPVLRKNEDSSKAAKTNYADATTNDSGYVVSKRRQVEVLSGGTGECDFKKIQVPRDEVG